MIGALAKKLFGSANDRAIKSLKKYVDAINALEPDLERLSDDELRARTDQFRERLEAGEELDDLMARLERGEKVEGFEPGDAEDIDSPEDEDEDIP